MIRRLKMVLLFSLLVTLLFGGEPISFKGGYTRAVMREGRETILLSQGASVSSGSIHFEAQTIELIGPDARYLVGNGAVKITDTDNNIVINSTGISFDRESEQLLVDGWVEVQDLNNEIIATGAYLAYDRTEGVIKIQIAAKLLHHTDSGPMVCRADTIEFNRESRKLSLIGNSVVEWKGDVYRASSTTVDLDSEEIEMEGTIKGTVHG